MKKILFLGVVALFMSIKMNSQCQISATTSYNSTYSCNNSNITLSGTATLKKSDSEGFFQPCGGGVSVQLQKLISSAWSNIGSPYITTGAYSFAITSGNGSGSYRIVVSNPNSNCSCASTTNYTSGTTVLTFNSNLHDNSYSLNGVATFNTGCTNFNFCQGQPISMNNIVMTYPSSTTNVNKWRISTANDTWLTNTTWTLWTNGIPPSSYDILNLLQTNYGSSLPSGNYGIQLQTYNGCTTVTHFACLNILSAPTFSVGQKYDATNSTNISSSTTCSSPFNNICPVYSAPYSYMMTAINSSIPSNQVTNGQWSCSLEEVPVSNCAATPSLIFNTSYATIGSMSNLDNIDLNALAVAAGFPANYISYAKRYKFTLNIKYSCGNIYTYTCWLRYSSGGCRIMNKQEGEVDETIDHSISFFPNPVTSIMEIKTDNTIQSVTLIDISGKEIKAELKNNTIDLSKFSAGIYTIKVYTNDGVSIEKIIKQD